MAKKKKKRTRKKSRATSTGVKINSTAVNTIAKTATKKSREFNPDYSYVIKDLKRIGTLAGIFFVVLIVLSFFLG